MPVQTRNKQGINWGGPPLAATPARLFDPSDAHANITEYAIAHSSLASGRQKNQTLHRNKRMQQCVLRLQMSSGHPAEKKVSAHRLHRSKRLPTRATRAAGGTSAAAKGFSKQRCPEPRPRAAGTARDRLVP